MHVLSSLPILVQITYIIEKLVNTDFFLIFFSVFTFFIQFITKQYIYIYVIYSKHRSKH